MSGIVSVNSAACNFTQLHYTLIYTLQYTALYRIGRSKFHALQKVATAFKLAHGRFPTLWLDVVWCSQVLQL